MNIDLGRAEMTLVPGQLLKVRANVGSKILCHAGAVWITLDRDRRDVLLETGDAFEIDKPGVTLINALRGAPITMITIEEPVRPRRHVPIHSWNLVHALAGGLLKWRGAAAGG